MRVCVLDDDPDLLDILSEAFSTAGHEVFAFRNISEDLAPKIKEAEPDVVIADVNMPGDGYAISDLLREVKHAPIVLVTGMDEELDIQKHGAVAVIKKPFSFTEILDIAISAAESGHKTPLRLMQKE